MPQARRSKRKKPNLDAPLKQLEAAQLIRRLTEEEDAYWFKHVLVQETAYESLLKHDRKRIHRAVAQVIERAEPNRLDELAARLAQHYAEAGDEPRTFEYLLRAGDFSARMQANAEAIARYSQALELLGKVRVSPQQLQRLYASRGRALELTGDYDRALENYDALARAGRERRDRALELAALMARATIHSAPTARFDPPKAQALAEETLALAQELGDRASEAKVLWNMMLLAYFVGDPVQAERFGQQSLALAREHNLREQLGYTLNDLGRVYQALGRFDEAFTIFEEARAIWYELDNKPMLVDNMVSRQIKFLLAGDYDKVLQLSDEAYRLSEAIGSSWGQAYSRMGSGLIFWQRGQIEQAIRRMEDCLRQGEQAGFLIATISERSQLGLVYANMGDLDAGFRLAREAIDRARMIPSGKSAMTAVLVQLETLAGNLDQAERDLEESYRTVGRTNLTFGNIYTLLAEGELALQKGDTARASRVAQDVHRSLETVGAKIFTVDALWIQARAQLAVGATGEALNALAEARARATASGMRNTLWKILMTMSDIERARENEESARALRSEAREILDYIVNHTPQDLREKFIRLPQVKRALENH